MCINGISTYIYPFSRFAISHSDKDRDVEAMTHRIRGELNDEIKNGQQLRAEINALKTQLEESKAGLLAAARISDQLEICQVTNATLKEERKRIFFGYRCMEFINCFPLCSYSHYAKLHFMLRVK